MSGDDAGFRVDKNGIIEAELCDRSCDLGNCASEWVRGFLAYGINLSSAQCSIRCAVARTFSGDSFMLPSE